MIITSKSCVGFVGKSAVKEGLSSVVFIVK